MSDAERRFHEHLIAELTRQKDQARKDYEDGKISMEQGMRRWYDLEHKIEELKKEMEE